MSSNAGLLKASRASERRKAGVAHQSSSVVEGVATDEGGGSGGAPGSGGRSWVGWFLSRESRPRNLFFAFVLAYYAGQPPLHWPAAAWLSCLLFAWMVGQQGCFSRRELAWAWIASSVMWLALLQGIRLAFWPLTAGWIALSLYLAVYLPLALAIATGLRGRWRVPLPWACAVAWTTVELTRSYFLTGFAGCALSHSQTPWPMLLQVASHFGGYGVGFLMMLTCGWVIEQALEVRDALRRTEAVPVSRRRGLARNLTTFMIAIWLTGSWMGMRTRDERLAGMQPIKPIGRFLLIQDHMPTMFEANPESVEAGWRAYEMTTRRAMREVQDPANIDALIWPESVFAGAAPYLVWDRGSVVPEDLGMDLQQLQTAHRNLTEYHQVKLKRLQAACQNQMPNLLVGCDLWDVRDGQFQRFNAALWIERESLATDHYAKNHLVMFGEYIPVLAWFPSMMKAVGLATLSSGREPEAWRLRSGRRVAPSICFEDMVPHLMRSHMRRLTRRGESPDVLINISNDAWFRGSSLLDHHLNSAILTAVENRVPMLVSANTGITAWIDGDGRVVRRLPKLESGYLLAEPIPDGRVGWWSTWGDLPARAVACLGWLSMVLAWIRRRPPNDSSLETVLAS